MRSNLGCVAQAIALGFLFSLAGATTTLFGGGESIILGNTTTQACLNAFNTTLNCDQQVQLLSYDMDRLEWTQSKLTAVCTPSCLSSLQSLLSAVGSACAGHEIPFSGTTLAASDIVELYLYKYQLSCLTETSSGSFCLMVEETWDVGALESSGNATWPEHTNVTFPDFTESTVGTPATDTDGTLIDNSDPYLNFTDLGLELPWIGQDYYQTGTVADWIGHGWPEPLEYDEYPLEIQCSDCFLSQYKIGVESKWGEVYDEVSDQVWRNMQLNCQLDWEIVPANNLSTWNISAGPLIWNSATAICPRTVQVNNVTSGGSGINGVVTANDIAQANNVPTYSVLTLNDGNVTWNFAAAGPYCLPETCQVAIITAPTNAWDYATHQANASIAQFWQWNPNMDPWHLATGEVVCVGPPGGAYTPVAGFPAQPSVYTTTAKAAYPTPSGTVANCGLYYEVVSGDECDTVALAYALTLSQFLAMNPSLDANCSNLLTGLDYCVALVNGTTITSTSHSSSSMPKTTTTKTSTATTTAHSSGVSTPSPIQTGMAKNCNKFYDVASGDTCAAVATKYDISLTNFYAWNPAVGSTCAALELKVYVCVGVSATSKTTAKVTSTGISTPSPIQTGMTKSCKKFYDVASGDTCAAIATKYDISLTNFYAWNPAVGSTCAALELKVYVCVGVS